MPPIVYKLRSLNDVPETASVKTAHMAAKTSVLVLHYSDKNRSFPFRFGNHHSTKFFLLFFCVSDFLNSGCRTLAY